MRSGWRLRTVNGDDAVRNYCLNILKAKKVAVIGDTTGYGVTAVGVSVAGFKKDGADVVYQANIDSTQPDMTPDMLRAKDAGAEVIVVWSVSTGMEARMFNSRAAMNWDVSFVGHPSMSSGEIAGLVEKPANWKKVYAIGYRSCSYDSAGKLPAKSEDLVGRLLKANVAISDTLLWWVAGGIDAIDLIAKAVQGKRIYRQRRHRQVLEYAVDLSGVFRAITVSRQPSIMAISRTRS